MLAAVFAVHALLMSRFPRYLAEERVISRLAHDGQSLLERLEIGPDKAPQLLGQRIAPIYSTVDSGHYFEIITPNGMLRSPSLGAQALDLPPLRNKDADTLHISGPGNAPLLVLVRRMQLHGQPVTVVFAEEIADIIEDISETRRIYYFGVSATVVLLILLQRYYIRRSLKPLEKARAELADIESGKASRIHQPVPAEIQPLVDEINHLLEVMEKRLKQSRRSAGNLAHALKTPLSILRQIADSDEVRGHPQMAQEMAHISQSMEASINRELKRARLAGKAAPGRGFDAAKEIPDIVDVMKKVYAEKGLEFGVMIPADAVINADREDMMELLGNLLDNSCKWANSRVKLTLKMTPQPVITLEDDGSGIDDSRMRTLTRRGVRLDKKTPGHGLGLSIVSDIVDQYDGRLLFSRSDELGGLKVRVEFPKN